jgi:hypothetical protein
VHGDADHSRIGVGGVDPFVVFGKFDRHWKSSWKKWKESGM